MLKVNSLTGFGSMGARRGWSLVYRGSKQYASGSTFGGQQIQLGPVSRDRIVLIGYSAADGSGYARRVTSLTLQGARATELAWCSGYGVGWYKINLGGSASWIDGTLDAAGAVTVFVYTLTGSVKQQGASIASLDAVINNSNYASVNFTGCLADDYFLMVGHKPGNTGAMGAFAASGANTPTSNAQNIRTGTNGFSSATAAWTGFSGNAASVTLTAVGYDSSKGIMMSALRVRRT